MPSDEFSLVNAGLTIAFVIYSIFVIVVGIWGHSIVPRNCSNPDVRSNLRGLLVSGFMSLMAFIGYSMCNLICVRKEEVIMPTWMVFFIFGLSLGNLVMVSQLQTAMGNDSTCTTGKYDSFKQILTFFSVLSGMVMGISFISLVYRGYEYQTKLKTRAAQKAKNIEMENIRKTAENQLETLKKENEILQADSMVQKQLEMEKLKKQLLTQGSQKS